MNNPNAVERVNSVLMVAACAAVFVAPFHVFLAAYAVLGPLHYLTADLLAARPPLLRAAAGGAAVVAGARRRGHGRAAVRVRLERSSEAAGRADAGDRDGVSRVRHARRFCSSCGTSVNAVALIGRGRGGAGVVQQRARVCAAGLLHHHHRPRAALHRGVRVVRRAEAAERRGAGVAGRFRGVHRVSSFSSRRPRRLTRRRAFARSTASSRR